MFPWVRPKNSAIMFDVGTTGIRACQLARRGPSLVLRDHLRLALHAAGDTPDPGGALDCDRLVRTLTQARFAGRSVGLVLSPPAVQFHTLEVPERLLSNSREAIHKALAWEIARETRTEPGQWEVRYWPFPSGHRPGRNVMSVAVSSPLVRGWVSDFARHGLRLTRVTASPCALARVAAAAWPPEEEDVWGVLDVGHGRSVLTVLVARSPVYVRVVATGAADWSGRLARAFDVSAEEARQIMERHGLRQPDAAARGGPEAQDAQQLHTQASLCSVLFATLRPALDALVREINRCFLYVLESYPNLSVSRLFVAGGGGGLGGLPEYLELQLDLPTRRLMGAAAPENGPDGLGIVAADVPPETAASLGGSLLDVEAPSCSR